MPIQEFSGNASVLIEDGGGSEVASFALPFSNGKVIAKPKRPDGPPFRRLVDGRRKERRATGWYLDVEAEWDELSVPAHDTLVSCIDALHRRSGTDRVKFKPEPKSASAISYWRVVPAISEGDIDLIYEDRVRAREASLMLKARTARDNLPSWFD